MADFHRAGGRTVAISDDDIRTMTAPRDLIGEDAAELTGWLRARRPAHGLTILREALGDDGYTPPPVETAAEPQPEPEPLSDKVIIDVTDDVPETVLPRPPSSMVCSTRRRRSPPPKRWPGRRAA